MISQRWLQHDGVFEIATLVVQITFKVNDFKETTVHESGARLLGNTPDVVLPQNQAPEEIPEVVSKAAPIAEAGP
jgi:hypothetical protein